MSVSKFYVEKTDQHAANNAYYIQKRRYAQVLPKIPPVCPEKYEQSHSRAGKQPRNKRARAYEPLYIKLRYYDRCRAVGYKPTAPAASSPSSGCPDMAAAMFSSPSAYITAETAAITKSTNIYTLTVCFKAALSIPPSSHLQFSLSQKPFIFIQHAI